MKKETVVVAMSGGVDSSVVAAIMKKEGYNVIGITLQLYDQGMVTKTKSCCAGQDIYDAKMVASKIGIPHYVLDYESKFKEDVIDKFVDSYVSGETPLPCVSCNQSVKFNDLLNFSKELGSEILATGHYVRRINGNFGPELHTGMDLKKDQSYFLFATTKNQLKHLSFPLGGMDKDSTRKIAKEFELPVFDKPDSQDICFVPNGSYRDIVEKLRPDAKKPGAIMHIDGYKLGDHDGIINYTIGQRRRIDISFNSALYVVKIDPLNNIVYVGPESALKKKTFYLRDVNWLGEGDKPLEGEEIVVKIRSTQNAVGAKLFNMDNKNIKVELNNYEKAITPGQACVFYNNQRVLGGGWINKVCE